MADLGLPSRRPSPTPIRGVKQQHDVLAGRALRQTRLRITDLLLRAKNPPPGRPRQTHHFRQLGPTRTAAYKLVESGGPRSSRADSAVQYPVLPETIQGEMRGEVVTGIFRLKVLVYVGIEAELCFSLLPPSVRRDSPGPSSPESPSFASCQT